MKIFLDDSDLTLDARKELEGNPKMKPTLWNFGITYQTIMSSDYIRYESTIVPGLKIVYKDRFQETPYNFETEERS